MTRRDVVPDVFAFNDNSSNESSSANDQESDEEIEENLETQSDEADLDGTTVELQMHDWVAFKFACGSGKSLVKTTVVMYVGLVVGVRDQETFTVKFLRRNQYEGDYFWPDNEDIMDVDKRGNCSVNRQLVLNEKNLDKVLIRDVLKLPDQFYMSP